MCSWNITILKIPLRNLILSILAACGLLTAPTLYAQSGPTKSLTGPYSSTTPKLHYEFPFQMMWDDAVLTSEKTGKPTLAFDLDLIAPTSIKLAKEVLASKPLQSYIRSHFEPAMNDFATDPPPIVGMDSLRNLGWRLSGLEKDYMISVRPCMIVIGTDKKEIDRIVFPEKMTAAQLETRLGDILANRNTIGSADSAFWRGDTNSVDKREHLIAMLEERSKYDSVLYHLSVLAKRIDVPVIARAAATRYAWLRLGVEGNTGPIEALIGSLGTSANDSALEYSLLKGLLKHFTMVKKHDSVAAMYERIMAFTGHRDPDLLNEYAWQLANYSQDTSHAWALINEAMAQKHDDPDYYDTRAMIDGRMHHYSEAVQDETTALALAGPKDKTYFEQQLGYYKKLKSEVEEAARAGKRNRE